MTTPERQFVDALCLVLPDGTVRWLEPDREALQRALWDWTAEHPEFSVCATSGVVQIRMPIEVFERMRTPNAI